MLSDKKLLDLYVATFPNLELAEAAYQAAKDGLYDDSLETTFEAVVITKDEEGKIKVVDKHEQATRSGALIGGVIGVAGGLLTVLFPPVGIMAVLAGAGLGAGLGAITGHIVGGLSRHDLADLGQALDEGDHAVVIVTDNHDEDTVRNLLAGSEAIVKRNFHADLDAMKTDLEAAEANKSTTYTTNTESATSADTSETTSEATTE